MKQCSVARLGLGGQLACASLLTLAVLTGCAVTGSANLLGELSVSPGNADFGNVPLGSSANRSFAISNVGKGNLTISQAGITGSGYGITGATFPLTLLERQSANLTVQFAPTALGPTSATLNLIHNGLVSSNTVSLAGTGSAAPAGKLSVSPGTLDFGDVLLGSNSVHDFNASNTGNAVLSISQAMASGAGMSITGATFPITLAAGQSRSFQVQFAPIAEGAVTGDISFSSSAPGPHPSISLKGSGRTRSGKLATSPASLDFGSVNLGSSSTKSFTASNTGNSNLIISQATASGSGMSLTSAISSVTLAPGQSQSFQVRFAPVAVGNVSGSVSLVNNVGPTASVPLSGKGVGVPAMSLNPSSLSFGVNVGSSDQRSVAITNSGTASLTSSQASVSGNGFSISGLTLPMTLAVGQSISFQVWFAPTAAGSVSGSVALASNAPGSPHSVTLSGNGVQPPTTQVTGVTISPTAASVEINRTLQFSATVQGTVADTSVIWSATAGTISSSGQFTAPATAGSVTVKATSNADASKSASATVTVTAPPPPPSGALAAFPGAMGGGAQSIGGRGGRVIEVTNLNDSGPGSLRACAAASGPRTCVFRVGGTISLLSDLDVVNPYLTIAGQTAPGGGILLRGTSVLGYMLAVRTHDVIVRYLRVRLGYNSSRSDQSGSNIVILPGAYNVVVDHCSISWSDDENVVVWANSGPGQHNVTIQWSLVAEGLEGHSTGMITGAANHTLGDAIQNVDLHHSLLMNNMNRNPLIKTNGSRVVNNLIYNWSYFAMGLEGGAKVDILGNKFKSGPLSPNNYEVRYYYQSQTGTASPPLSVYLRRNVGPHNSSGTLDNWLMMNNAAFYGSDEGLVSRQYERSAPLAAQSIPISEDPVSSLESLMLPAVGASHRLDCNGNWVANRDAVDTRLINEYQTGAGRIPVRESDVGGFPTIASGTPCTDTDADGMPDAWEATEGLTPNDPSDGPRIATNGYTNLENYLNGSPQRSSSLRPYPGPGSFLVAGRTPRTTNAFEVHGLLDLPIGARSLASPLPASLVSTLRWHTARYLSHR